MASYNPASQGMGISNVGVGDPNVIFKRKNRWTFEVNSIQGSTCPFSIPPHFVKMANRPNITIEETQIDFLNDRTWIPGKATWEAITVTYLDVAGVGVQPSEGVRGIHKWLAAVYDFTGKNGRKQSSKRSGYAGKATLTLYDGCGGPLEVWTLGDAWPTGINFGDLTYEDSGIVEIELTIRYSKVEVQFFCPADQIPSCCSGCG